MNQKVAKTRYAPRESLIVNVTGTGRSAASYAGCFSNNGASFIFMRSASTRKRWRGVRSMEKARGRPQTIKKSRLNLSRSVEEDQDHNRPAMRTGSQSSRTIPADLSSQ